VNRRGLRVSACIAVIGLMVCAGCETGEIVDARRTATGEPWRRTVHFVDPERRFALDFPAAPVARDEPDGPLVIHTLRARVLQEWFFDLAWSDAPPGTPLVASQTIRPQTPEENAARDGGEVTARANVRMFGRDALEFTVESRDGRRGLYRDLQIVLGGRLYELTVLQPAGDRRAFDRFVRSFGLLEPPVRAGADFFARAATLCRTLRSSAPQPPGNATPVQRGAAVSRGADAYASIARTLAATPASPDDQGDAAAMIDAMRRSIEPARRFAKAVSENRSDARALGRATHGDTDLVDVVAGRHGVRSCA
jgi:hypothetical protein